METTLTWPRPSSSELEHSSPAVLRRRHGSTSVQLVLKPSSEKSRPPSSRSQTLVNCETLESLTADCTLGLQVRLWVKEKKCTDV